METTTTQERGLFVLSSSQGSFRYLLLVGPPKHRRKASVFPWRRAPPEIAPRLTARRASGQVEENRQNVDVPTKRRQGFRTIDSTRCRRRYWSRFYSGVPRTTQRMDSQPSGSVQVSTFTGGRGSRTAAKPEENRRVGESVCLRDRSCNRSRSVARRV